MQKGVHWGLVKINRLPFMTLLFTSWLCLDPCHTSSLSLSLLRANIVVGGWIPSAIKRLTRISELPKHWPKIICTPEPGILLPSLFLSISISLSLSAVDIPNAKLFRPRLFTRSQLGAEPTHPIPSPLLFHLLPRIPCNPILTNALLAITTHRLHIHPSNKIVESFVNYEK